MLKNLAFLLVRIEAQDDVGEFGKTNFFTRGKFFIWMQRMK